MSALQLICWNLGGARARLGAAFTPQQAGLLATGALRAWLPGGTPVVVALQEHSAAVRDGVPGSMGAAIAAGLGEHAAAPWAWAAAHEVSSDGHPHARLWMRDCYTGASWAAEGNAIVTNMAAAPWPWPTPPGTVRWALEASVGGARLYSTGTRDTQPRNVMVASLAHPQWGPLFVLNTHLGTLAGEERHNPTALRSAQAARQRMSEVVALLAVIDELRAAEVHAGQRPRPVLLAGDFNATPHAPELGALHEAGLTVVPLANPPTDTWTHTRHQQWIDHVWLHDPAGALPRQPHGWAAPTVPLTDHRAVLVGWGGAARVPRDDDGAGTPSQPLHGA